MKQKLSNTTGSSKARVVSWLKFNLTQNHSAVPRVSKTFVNFHFTLTQATGRLKKSKFVCLTHRIRREPRSLSEELLGCRCLPASDLATPLAKCDCECQPSCRRSLVCLLSGNVWSLTAVIPRSQWACVKQTVFLLSMRGRQPAGEWLLGHAGNLLPSR